MIASIFRRPHLGHKAYLVFDCDGTLIASQGSILEALRVLMSEIQQRPVTLNEAAGVYDPDMLACAKNMGVDITGQETLERLSKRWIELCQSVGRQGHFLYDGIAELIKSMSERGHEIYVWTARDRQSTREIMMNLGLAPYILDMRCMDDTTPKPHPQGLIDMLGDAPKDDVIVIGDSTTDMQGAREFGVRSLAALWGEHVDRERLASAGATFFAKDPQECGEIIEKYLSGEIDV